MVLALLLACHGAAPPVTSPRPAGSAAHAEGGGSAASTDGAGSAASTDGAVLAPLDGGWSRLAWLEGRWQPPPETSGTPPLEVLAPTRELVVRSGAGEARYHVERAARASGGVVLELSGEGGPTRATFTPWSEVSGERPPVAPPGEAWGVATPGRALDPTVAWYRGGVPKAG